MNVFRYMSLILCCCGFFLITKIAVAEEVKDDNQEELSENDRQNRPIATVIRFRPDVLIKEYGSEDWKPISIAQTLFSLDSLKTGPNGYAMVRYMDLSEFRMRPNSILAISGEVRGKGNTLADLSMQAGDILLEVVRGQSNHSITTPTAVAAVKGTSFSVKLDEDNTANYTGFSGEVEITRTGTDEVYELSSSSRIIIPPSVDIPPIIDVIQDEEFDFMMESFDEIVKFTAPEVLRVRVMDKDGNVRTIRIPYFINEN